MSQQFSNFVHILASFALIISTYQVKIQTFQQQDYERKGQVGSLRHHMQSNGSLTN